MDILFLMVFTSAIDKTNPAITLNYDVKDVSVQKAFTSFNTIRSLMPIGKFLDGKLNSQLSMTGNLNSDMMPKLTSLTGKGNLLLIEGVLRKFAPLEKLAATLQIDRLKSFSVRDIKNYITFANGKVTVNPFTVKLDDIVMEVGGMHGFDQSLEYIIGLKLPRKYLGNSGNNLINGLAAQATSKGLPVKLGDIVDLHVRVGGTVTNPTLKIDLEKVVGDAVESMKEQAKDYIKQQLDSLRNRGKDSVAGSGKKITEGIKDKIKDQIFGKDTSKTITDTTKKKPTSPAVKDVLKDIFNRPKKQKDTLKN